MTLHASTPIHDFLSPRRAVLLDCDGVLVDSESLSARALEGMLAARGVEVRPGVALLQLRGRRVATWVAELFAGASPIADSSLQVALARETPDLFEEEFRSVVAQCYQRGLAAEPHAQHLLDLLTERRVRWAVVSNAPAWKVRQGLDCAGLDTYGARACVSAYDLGSWKPEPGVYLRAARELGVAPAASIAVEDSDVGVRAAVAAGMPVVHYCRDREVPTHPLAAARSFDHRETARLVLDLFETRHHQGAAV